MIPTPPGAATGTTWPAEQETAHDGPPAVHDLQGMAAAVTPHATPRIVVVGVGGAGCNAVNNMIEAGLEGVEFIVANTDAQSLAQSNAARRVQLGIHTTEGLGAGAKPDIGAAAAEEALEAIVEQLSGAHMAFITAGMGGGTGTGAAPVIAEAARDQGILTVGVVTMPFEFEGQHRMALAEDGMAALQGAVDTLIVIPNQNLFRICDEKTTFRDAFRMADDVLYCGVRGVTDLMVMPGLINLDFADIRTVMGEMGKVMLGLGEASGDGRAIEAATLAMSNPLLGEVSVRGARAVLINITGGLDMTLYEVDEAANRIRDEVDPSANIILGSAFDEALDGLLRVSLLCTGITDAAGLLGETYRSPAAESSAATEEYSTTFTESGPYEDEVDEPDALDATGRDADSLAPAGEPTAVAYDFADQDIADADDDRSAAPAYDDDDDHTAAPADDLDPSADDDPPPADLDLAYDADDAELRFDLDPPPDTFAPGSIAEQPDAVEADPGLGFETADNAPHEDAAAPVIAADAANEPRLGRHPVAATDQVAEDRFEPMLNPPDGDFETSEMPVFGRRGAEPTLDVPEVDDGPDPTAAPAAGDPARAFRRAQGSADTDAPPEAVRQFFRAAEPRRVGAGPEDKHKARNTAQARGPISSAARLVAKLTGLAAANRGDYSAALTELQPLAEQGDATAQYNLGDMHARGDGVPQNYVEARHWFYRAAMQHNVPAQFDLAMLYDKGRGVAADLTQAFMWYQVAANNGHPDAAERLEMVQKSMSARQLEAALERVRQWQPDELQQA